MVRYTWAISADQDERYSQIRVLSLKIPVQLFGTLLLETKNFQNNYSKLSAKQYDLRHEKTCFLHMLEQRHDQLHGNSPADLRLCLSYIDRAIPLLPKSEISSR